MVSCPMALEHYCSARTLTNFRQLAFSLSGQSSLDLGPDNYLIFFFHCHHREFVCFLFFMIHLSTLEHNS
jgi:hypothetical protein